jgi:hypothetical protein
LEISADSRISQTEYAAHSRVNVIDKWPFVQLSVLGTGPHQIKSLLAFDNAYDFS